MNNKKRSYISRQKRKYELYSRRSILLLIITFIIWIICSKMYDHAVQAVDLANISKYSDACITLAICMLIETIVTASNIIIRYIYEVNYPSRPYYTKEEQKKFDRQIIDDLNNDNEL